MVPIPFLAGTGYDMLPRKEKFRYFHGLSCIAPFFDNFHGQCTENLLKRIDNNHINVILIPPNCTDCLQPLDLSVNKSIKYFLRVAFQE